MADDKLSLRTKLGFGVGDLGGNLFFTVLSFSALNYLTDVVGILAASAGTALMAGKLWDALVDPMVGLVSDRTRTRWGRRRPYLLFGALPLGIAMALFFSAPGLTDQPSLFWWALLLFALLNTAYSFVSVPYGSLTPELTADYHERTSLNGYRFSFAIIGTFCGAALVLPILGLFPGSPQAGFRAVGVIFGAVIALTALVTGFSVRERQVAAPAGGLGTLWKSWQGVWKNKPFRIILGTYTLHIIGLTFLMGMIVYYFKYVIKDMGAYQLALVLLLGVAMVSIPLSVLFSKKFGKVRTYQVSMVLMALSALVAAFFGASQGSGFVVTVMAAAGVGMGFGYVPPFAILPDAIEVEALKTGQREEGAYYGLWNLAVKLSQAAGLAGSGLILGWAGYVADKPTPESLDAIQALLGPVPAVFFLAAALLLMTYPLDEKTYSKAVHKES